MKHYNLEKQPKIIQDMANNDSLSAPCFIGQGITKRSGSDCYGYYIAEIMPLTKTKMIVGLAKAQTKLIGNNGYGGGYDCSIDMSKIKADMWIINYSKYRKTGTYKWIECQCDGTYKSRWNLSINWNGASEYLDPSF